jgi:IS1 family transposase
MGLREHKVERRLAAIFAADVAGYSRLMSRDEMGTLRTLTASREVMDRLIAEHGGRIANTAGDSVLAQFPSAVDAVACAVAVQETLAHASQDILRRKLPSTNDLWHLDEVVISIARKKHWLWQAVDQDGYVLDGIVQSRRNTKAAKRLLTRLMKKQGIAPKRTIADKLPSYAAAKRQVMPSVEHQSRKGLNNNAENSHLPLRERERMM